jgi:CheY-like chemotaxis protein
MDTVAPTQKPKVLIIEDEPAVARALQRALRNYEVQTVGSVPEGVDALADAGGAVVAVLCDLHMAGQPLQAWDFHRLVEERLPDELPRITYMHGGLYTTESTDFVARVRAQHPVLAKPLMPQALREFVQVFVDAGAASASACAVRLGCWGGEER